MCNLCLQSVCAVCAVCCRALAAAVTKLAIEQSNLQQQVESAADAIKAAAGAVDAERAAAERVRAEVAELEQAAADVRVFETSALDKLSGLKKGRVTYNRLFPYQG